MNTNKNFLRFMGYRKQVFTVDGTMASANAVVLDADFGNIVLPGTAGTDLEVTILEDASPGGTNARGT